MNRAPARAEEKAAGQEGEVRAPTVLVVDDFDEIRCMLGIVLRMNGYRMLEAADGREAVEVARRALPDLILMDLNLPVLDGLAATRRLRELPEMREVPIIAITAYGTPDYRLRALAAGCDQLLTKPLDITQLEDALNTFCPNRAVPPTSDDENNLSQGPPPARPA